MLASLLHRTPRADPHSRVVLMGVLNVTPDSFSDGGQYLRPSDAFRRIDELLEEGADVIDIGGESTRPGSERVPADEQVRRVLPAVEYAVSKGAVVSIDTTEPSVANAALEAGARVVNDVSCARGGTALAETCASHGAWYILMHAREPMEQMKGFSVYPDEAYEDVVQDVLTELREATERLQHAGVQPDHILWDPGLGFNKNARHSSELVRRLDELAEHGHHLVVGASRKSFLASDVPSDPSERVASSAVAAVAAVLKGASVLRVHDVRQTRQALAVARRVGLLPRSAFSATGEEST